MKCPKCKEEKNILPKKGLCFDCFVASETKGKVKKPRRRKPRNLESKLQVNCVNWFRYQYPKLMLFSVPNGGSRNKIEASRLKKEGVLAGVADLCLLIASRGYFACFIELKVGNNKQSKYQKDFEKYCDDNRYCYQVVYSLEEFMEHIEWYLE